MRNAYACEHDQCYVVHLGADCPLCTAMERIKELEQDAESLQGQFSEADAHVQELERELNARG